MKKIFLSLFLFMVFNCGASEFSISPVTWKADVSAKIRGEFNAVLKKFTNISRKFLPTDFSKAKLTLNKGFDNSSNLIAAKVFIGRESDGRISWASISLTDQINWNKDEIMLHWTLVESVKTIFHSIPKEGPADYYMLGVSPCELYEIRIP